MDCSVSAEEGVLIPQYSKNKQHKDWATNIELYQIYKRSWEHSRRTRVTCRLVWRTRLTACVAQSCFWEDAYTQAYRAYHQRSHQEDCSAVSKVLLRNGVDSKTRASLTCMALAKVARKTTPLVLHRCSEWGQRGLFPHCAQGIERRWGTTKGLEAAGSD